MPLSYGLCSIQIYVSYLFIYVAPGIAITGNNVRDATEHEFPFTVSISDKNIGSSSSSSQSEIDQFCTGTLITRKHVLTAEHCLATKQVENVEILAGSVHLDRCRAYDPETWITYQEWKYRNQRRIPPLIHDIAIITLKNCVDDVNVQLATMTDFNPKDVIGSKVKVAGRGWTNGNVKPKVLKTVDLKVLSKEECQSNVSQLRKENFFLYDWQLCSMSEPWAIVDCGDSGGPVLNERNQLIGITLATCPDESDIFKKYPRQLVYVNRLQELRVSIHASLHYYTDFIKHVAKNINVCDYVKRCTRINYL